MDCKEAEDLRVPYLLGELGTAETEQMSGHAAACRRCMSKIDSESELLVRLSSMEPAPQRVKQKLLARVEADMARQGKRGWLGRLSAMGRSMAAHSAPAVVATLLVGVVLGGVWYNGRLDEVRNPANVNAAGVVAANSPEMIELVDQQLFLDPLGLQPGVSISLLEGAGTDARGVVLLPPSDGAAFLAVRQMPQLPPGKVYQVWLTRDGGMYSAGTFSVDAQGYGQARLRLIAPATDLESIVITIERSGGSPGPTGQRVLSGGM